MTHFPQVCSKDHTSLPHWEFQNPWTQCQKVNMSLSNCWKSIVPSSLHVHKESLILRVLTLVPNFLTICMDQVRTQWPKKSLTLYWVVISHASPDPLRFPGSWHRLATSSVPPLLPFPFGFRHWQEIWGLLLLLSSCPVEVLAAAESFCLQLSTGLRWYLLVWSFKHRVTVPTSLWTPHPPVAPPNPAYPSVHMFSLTLCLQNRWPSVPSIPCARIKPRIQILALPPPTSVPPCL